MPWTRFEGTVLAVTHDRWFARSFDRFLVFGSDGKVYESDEPVWDEKRVVARSVGVVRVSMTSRSAAPSAPSGPTRSTTSRSCRAGARATRKTSSSTGRSTRSVHMPVLAAPMDSVVCPATAIRIGQLGGLGVLDLEGVWTRYDDPEPLLARSAACEDEEATGMQEIYSEPIKPDSSQSAWPRSVQRGHRAGALSPQRTQELYETVVAAGVDLFVIRGTTVTAEHVSKTEPLNLKKFIYELDVPVIVGGAATYTAALHLMRTGAAGVLVGFGGGAPPRLAPSLGIHAPWPRPSRMSLALAATTSTSRADATCT